MSQRTAIGLLLASICGLLFLGFVTVERDPPWGPLGNPAGFSTDEGWYTKGAQVLEREGRFTRPLDFSAFTHNPLHSALLAAAMRVFGAGLGVVRAVSLVLSSLGLVALYLLARRAVSSATALLVALACAASFLHFTYSRTAQPYAVALAFSLAALAAWAYSRSIASLAAGVAFAALGALFKASFLFTPAALGLLAAADGAKDLREGRGRTCAVRLGLAAAGVATVCAVYVVLSRCAPDSFATYQGHALDEMVGRHVPRTALALLVNEELTFWYFLSLRTRSPVLAIAAGVGLLVAIYRREWRAPRRPTVAVLVWLALGLLPLGLTTFRPYRFFYFAVPALAYLAVVATEGVAGKRRHALLACAIVLLHLAHQAPMYAQWLSRSRPESQADAARDVVRQILRDRARATLIGRTSAYVAIFDRRVRAIELDWLGLDGEHAFCDRLARYRPDHLLRFERDLADLPARCPALVERLQAVARYDIMENAAPKYGPAQLHRIVYLREARQAPLP